jgi:hypothetical protein
MNTIVPTQTSTVISRLDADPLVKKISNKYSLTSGVTFKVDDYRTSDDNDEAYYAKTLSLDLRRGLAAVYRDDVLLFVLAGLPKFGYITDVFTPPTSLVCEKRIYTMKENGEAGHLAFFENEGVWYAIIGSKNVHIVLSLDHFKEDLSYYRALPATRLEYAIANVMLLEKYHSDILFASDTSFKQYLYQNNFTIVFEAIYNNHIVEYNCEKMITFAITYPQQDGVPNKGLTCSPQETLELLSKQGFNVPQIDVVDFNDVDGIKVLDDKYEKLNNSEGAVVYEVCTGGVVRKIYKHKNHIYIIRRMVRELIKRQASYTAWVQRFVDIHFDASYLESEIKKLLAFYVWVKTNVVDGVKWADKIQVAFKELLHEFDSCVSIEEIDMFAAKAPTVLRGGANSVDHAVLLVGIQGSGKTSMRNALMKVFGTKKCTYVNQDELNGNRKAFIAALKGNKGKIMVVDKCNHLCKLREDVYNMYANVHIIEFQHPDGMDEMKVLSLERIKGRGLKHPNLIYSIHTNGILSRCAGAFEPVSPLEKQANTYLCVNPLDDLQCNVQKVIGHLGEYGVVAKVGGALGVGEEYDDTAYDQMIMEKMLKNVRYWQASANVEDVLKVLPSHVNLPNIKNEFHMTMFYETKVNLKKAKELMANPKIYVHIEALIYNDKCAALSITKTELMTTMCEKENPHITISLADGVPGVYANEMIQYDDTSDIVLMDCTLELTISPVMKK